MTEKRLLYLLKKHHSTNLSHEEANELSEWYDQQQQEEPDWIKGDKQSQLIAEMSAVIMNKINNEEKSSHRKIYNISPAQWMAAASIILLTGFVWVAIVFSSTRNKSLIAATKPPMIALPVFDTINNNGKVDKKTILPDGSTAVISPRSTISYQRNLPGKRRDIFLLTGKVFFDIKADKTKPFVVHTHDISTTALGTSFTITEHEYSELKIQLHTGKVLVQSQDDIKSFKPVYLDPGKEVFINTRNYMVSVRTTPVQKVITKMKPEITRAVSIVFEQDSLTTVFHKLSTIYKTNILYDSLQVSHLEFSGTIKTGGALSATLSKIALLNGLTVNKTKAGYVIIKP